MRGAIDFLSVYHCFLLAAAMAAVMRCAERCGWLNGAEVARREEGGDERWCC